MIKKTSVRFRWAIALLTVAGISAAGWSRVSSARGRREPLPFADLSITLEANETDGDGEVNIAIDSGDALKYVDVFDPNGRRVGRVRSRDQGKLGIGKMILETPELSVDEAKAAYPSGTYAFKGRTMDDLPIAGEAELSHDVPTATQFTSPTDQATGVVREGLVAAWSAVTGATGYVFELEQSDLGIELKAILPASSTSIEIPATLLVPNTSYQIGIGVTVESGNRSFNEIHFETGG